MADKLISDFPALSEVQDDDLLLVSSQGETYIIDVLTLKKAIKVAVAVIDVNYLGLHQDPITGCLYPTFDDKISEKGISIATPNGYGVCSTAAGVIAKEAEISNFVLQKGAMVAVQFKYANNAEKPTLNINGTGAKAIYNCYKSSTISTTDITAGMTCQLAYNGTQWVLLNPALTDGSEVSY